jgi:hypothetical protein
MYSYSDTCKVAQEIDMRPAKGFSCDQECGAGYYLTAQTTGARSTWQSTCAVCPVGKFSVGGGDLYAGTSLVWKQPWPLEFHTDCISQQNGHWKHGNCNSWAPGSYHGDEGAMVHSGMNADFQGNERSISILYLNANFVRDGWVRFRFRIDSERCESDIDTSCDGLTFVLDMNAMTEKFSGYSGWQDIMVAIPKGSHTLKWEYSKDGDTSMGTDKAYLELVAVNGTAFADTACQPCSGLEVGAGLSYLCRQCPAGKYAEKGQADYPCLPCPDGAWSVEGAVGAQQCRQRFPCAEVDMVQNHTACNGTTGTRRRFYSWSEPFVCNTTGSGAWNLTTPADAGQTVPCLRCDPGSFFDPGFNASAAPCSGCLQKGFADCTAQCQNSRAVPAGKFSYGLCPLPGSTEPTQCCSCHEGTPPPAVAAAAAPTTGGGLPLGRRRLGELDGGSAILKRNGCFACPVGKISDPVDPERCTQCPPAQYAQPQLLLGSLPGARPADSGPAWNSWAQGFNGPAAEADGWQLAGDAVATTATHSSPSSEHFLMLKVRMAMAGFIDFSFAVAGLPAAGSAGAAGNGSSVELTFTANGVKVAAKNVHRMWRSSGGPGGGAWPGSVGGGRRPPTFLAPGDEARLAPTSLHIPLPAGESELQWHYSRTGMPLSSRDRVEIYSMELVGVQGGGATKCMPCPPGHVPTPREGTTGAGSWWAAQGNCVPCPPGTVAAGVQPTCTACPAGKFSRGTTSPRAEDAATACVLCGQYTTSAAGSAACGAVDKIFTTQPYRALPAVLAVVEAMADGGAGGSGAGGAGGAGGADGDGSGPPQPTQFHYNVTALRELVPAGGMVLADTGSSGRVFFLGGMRPAVPRLPKLVNLTSPPVRVGGTLALEVSRRSRLVG